MNERATHTPGPWIARRRKVGKFTFGLQVFVEDRSYTNKSGNSIAIAVPHGSNADANARLIAAGPDLLEALELVLPWACKAVADHANQTIGRRALDTAYSAINTATGEESSGNPG